MPVVGWLFGGADFSNYFLRLGDIPAGFKGNPASYADLKAAGVAMFGWGEFITVFINFLLLAFVIFLIVRQANRLFPKPVEDAPAEPAEVSLLREIRDSLRK
jgi:large conductance mechanosensitive channel